MTDATGFVPDPAAPGEDDVRNLVLDAQRTLRPPALRSFFADTGTFWQVLTATRADLGALLHCESATTSGIIRLTRSSWEDTSDAEIVAQLSEITVLPPTTVNGGVAQQRKYIEELQGLLALVPSLGPRLAMHKVVGVCVKAQLFHLLTSHRIAHPTYNYLRTYDYSSLPWDKSDDTAPTTSAAWRVLGFDVGFPIGIPASVLTANSDWIRFYANRGFNILTFKTVRTRKRSPHPVPNWLFVKGHNSPLRPDADHTALAVIADKEEWPETPDGYSMVNSFGVPSVDPSIWQVELTNALELMCPGRLLIASVIGDERLSTFNDTVEDYVLAAQLVRECGAKAIELNLSCPNTIAGGVVKVDMIGTDPDASRKVVRAVRTALGNDVRLVIKLGYLPAHQLEAVLEATHEYLDGVSGINTLQVEVRDLQGTSAFPERPKAGLSGVAIRDLGLSFAKHAVATAQKLGRSKEDFSVIAMGGVMSATDVEEYQRQGASAVQTATAAFFNADLAIELARRYESEAQSPWTYAVEQGVLEELREGPRPFAELVRNLSPRLAPSDFEKASRARLVLNSLEARGVLDSTYQNGRLTFAMRTSATSRRTADR